MPPRRRGIGRHCYERTWLKIISSSAGGGLLFIVIVAGVADENLDSLVTRPAGDVCLHVRVQNYFEQLCCRNWYMRIV